jgi:hypothetical protein
MNNFCFGNLLWCKRFFSFSYKEPHSQMMWWKEPRAKTRFDIVERGVWHTTSQMLDIKYLQAYKTTFLGFQI